MDREQNKHIAGDRALKPGEIDRLGFRDIAGRIAGALVDHASDSGIVVGLNGSWGSGKSSLLTLIEEELQKLPTEKRPTVISFKPWLVGNRDALLTNLFEGLAHAIDQTYLAQGDATRASYAQAKHALETVRKFANRLSKAGELVEMAGSLWGPFGFIGKGLKSAGVLTEKRATEPSLPELKDSLTQSLRDLGHRFIITIDDVDRLEPSEVIEVLRLVRSVADFPNVIYLLCYDSEVLAGSIRRAANVDDGHAFLEKIVQLTVMVPQPESFQLRQWFSEGLAEIATPERDDELSRLKTIIDIEGGLQLKTPRAVVKTLDSIRFLWPTLKAADVDLADLVWLQLIKDGEPKLYRWIEGYCTSYATVSLGTAMVPEEAKKRSLGDLIGSVGDGYFGDLHYRSAFGEQLPGIEVDYDENGKMFSIHNKVDQVQRDAAIRDKRLASPDHYRQYFALSDPSHSIKQADFEKFWGATAMAANQTAEMLLELHDRPASGSLSKADILLERIRSAVENTITPAQAAILLEAFAAMMDTAYHKHPFDGFWMSSIWDRAEKLVSPLLSKLGDGERAEVIARMFSAGPAIGWLTSLFRTDTFAQGRYGDRTKPEAQWLFTKDEFDAITKIMLERYSKMTLEQVLTTPSPLDVVFAWKQGGDDDGPRALLAPGIENDQKLVQILGYMASSVRSSRGNYHSLKRSTLEPFMDYDAVRLKVRALASNATDPKTKAEANRLWAAFEDGDRFRT